MKYYTDRLYVINMKVNNKRWRADASKKLTNVLDEIAMLSADMFFDKNMRTPENSSKLKELMLKANLIFLKDRIYK